MSLKKVLLSPVLVSEHSCSLRSSHFSSKNLVGVKRCWYFRVLYWTVAYLGPFFDHWQLQHERLNKLVCRTVLDSYQQNTLRSYFCNLISKFSFQIGKIKSMKLSQCKMAFKMELKRLKSSDLLYHTCQEWVQSSMRFLKRVKWRDRKRLVTAWVRKNCIRKADQTIPGACWVNRY